MQEEDMYCNKPLIGVDSSFPIELLKIDSSFGYNSKKFYNLAALSEDVIVYGTGCYLHFLNLRSGQLNFRHSFSPDGIGAIASNPFNSHLAVAENGNEPFIFIYDWPSMKVDRILKKGTKKMYSHVTYNHDGTLLASQGSLPDFLLTIWNWSREEVVLRVKSFEAEVFQVSFTPFNPDQIVTCGRAHIKFWKMSETFTGLKLKSELGRFGKTDACDIVAAVTLPDGSVASSSQWGNILIWSEGKIHVEIFRTGHNSCHQGPITQLVFLNNALVTIGMDGAFRFWNYETIETADPTEEAPFLEMEPLFEFSAKDDQGYAELLCLVDATHNSSSKLWFAQDGKGSIWSLRLSADLDAQPHRQLKTHSGPVVGVQASPSDERFATLGSDGHLYVYSYVDKRMIMSKRLSSGGSHIYWPSLSIIPSGNILICGFVDGLIRTLAVDNEVRVLQAVKPFTRAVTCITFTDHPVTSEKLLICGSSDCTFFIFIAMQKHQDLFELVPVGCCALRSPVVFISGLQSSALVVACENGVLYVYDKASLLVSEETSTYRIDSVPKDINIAKIVYNEYFNHDPLQRNIQDSIIGKKVGEIHYLFIAGNGTIYFTYSDQGASIYEYDFSVNEIRKCRALNGCVVAPSCCLLWTDNSLIIGTKNGKIQAVRLQNEENDWWLIGAHEITNGAVRQLSLSWNSSHLFSCGDDGAVFSFRIHGHPVETLQVPDIQRVTMREICPDIEDATAFSLEEARVAKNQSEKSEAAERFKKETMEILSALENEYRSILLENERLPEAVRFSNDELIPDQRVEADLRRSLAEKDLVYRKLARDIERSELQLKKLQKYFLSDLKTLTIRVSAIESDEFVETYRLPRLGDLFENTLEAVKKRVEDSVAKGRLESTGRPLNIVSEVALSGPTPLEGLLKQVDMSRNMQLSRLYKQYKARRTAADQRALAWKEMLKREPDAARTDPEDLRNIELARETLGDHKLKTSPDYRVPRHLNASTINRYLSLLEVRRRIHNIKEEFNEKVLKMRSKKQDILSKHIKFRDELNDIKKNIPVKSRKNPPPLPVVNEELEFPEKGLEFSDYKNATNEMKTTQGEHPLSFDKGQQPYIPEIISKNFKSDSMSDWEEEIIKIGILRRTEQQDRILLEMNTDISDFNQRISDMSDERIEIDVKIKFLELHLLTLHREVLILKQFEKDEDDKTNLTFLKLKEREITQKQINDVTMDIEMKTSEIHNTEEEISILVNNYLASIAESKYFDFLKKIFKKKYRPPRVRTEDSEDSSESETESDSDDEDDESVDSRDAVREKLIETICPPNCDRTMYDQTFETRAARHEMEITISEKRKEIELLKKQFDSLLKKMKIVDNDYVDANRDLEKLQIEKQKKLNEIETVAILCLSQFQNFTPDDCLESLSDSVIIGSSALSKLYLRVGELMKETKQHREKHIQNRQHLQRMAIDIRYMKQVITRKENDIEIAMLRKFGTKVDLNELEESLLRNLIGSMNFVPNQLEQEFDQKLTCLKSKLKERQEIYVTRLEQNTERCNILTLLKEERSKLDDVLLKQEMRQDFRGYELDTSDLERLERLVQKQEEKLAEVRSEIQNLKYKDRPMEVEEEFTAAPSEMLEHSLIQGCDGKVQEISYMVRSRLKELAEEMGEVLTDTEEGISTQEGATRLKFLIDEFMDIVPKHIVKTIIDNVGEDVKDISFDDVTTLLKTASIAINLCETITPSVGANK